MYLQRRVLYCTSASKGNYNSNDVDSKLKLQKFRDAIVDISAPHNSFDYATKVVICQYNIRGLFGNVCSGNTLKNKCLRITKCKHIFNLSLLIKKNDYHSEANVSLFQGWTVIGTVSSDSHYFSIGTNFASDDTLD